MWVIYDFFKYNYLFSISCGFSTGFDCLSAALCGDGVGKVGALAPVVGGCSGDTGCDAAGSGGTSCGGGADGGHPACVPVGATDSVLGGHSAWLEDCVPQPQTKRPAPIRKNSPSVQFNIEVGMVGRFMSFAADGLSHPLGGGSNFLMMRNVAMRVNATIMVEAANTSITSGVTDVASAAPFNVRRTAAKP